MTFTRRPTRIAEAVEYIDEPAGDSELEASLDQIAGVNRWLGGTRALIRALRPLLPRAGPVSFLDVGTGSADVPRALVAWGAAHDRAFHVTASDRHPQTTRVARRRTLAELAITVLRANALRLPFADHAFDFSLCSLTLHHLADADQGPALRELARVARRAVLVNELERSWLNYFGARALAATIWRRNPLTRHDGPISVLRSFTPDELTSIARRAGFQHVRVRRSFFRRLVLVVELEPEPAAHPPHPSESAPRANWTS